MKRHSLSVHNEINRLDLAVLAREAITDIQEADLARWCPGRQIPDFADATIGDDVFSRYPSGDFVATLTRRLWRLGRALAPATGDLIELVKEVVPILVVELLDLMG